MFERISLQKNLGKKKAMVCTIVFIWGQKGETAYKWRATGEGSKFRERKRTRLSCEECGAKIMASLLRHHIERTNGKVTTYTLGVDVGGGGLETYVVSFPHVLKLSTCPV